MECIENGSMDGYERRFMDTAAFFEDRLAEGAMVPSVSRLVDNRLAYSDLSKYRLRRG